MDPQDILGKSYTESIHSSLRASIDPALDTDDESIDRTRRHSVTSIPRYPSSYHTSMAPSASNLSVKRPSMTENMTNFDTHMLSRTTTATSNNEGLPPEYPESVYTQNDDSPTPLPKMQMFIICIILFSEPLTSTILLPFIYFMLKDFKLSDDEKEIGLYAGWITSMFFLAQFCTAMMWGRLSDRHGRRPILLTGLIGNTISAIAFGLSKNLWWAIGTRTFCGIMNGNAAVARSALAELADATNRAQAFSLFGFCWGIGMIAGPTIGGYLCKPAEQFPSLFGDNEFLKGYPYFLPCFVASIGSMVGFVIGFFCLKETNPAVLERKRSGKAYKYYSGTEVEETRSLLRSSTHVSVRAGETPAESEEESKAAFKLSNASKMTIAAYAVWAFHAMILDEVLPLYFSAPSYAGGLGSNSQEFAKALAIGGIQQLFCQFYLYPKINQYLPTVTMARIAGYLFVPVYILFPELSTLKAWLLFHAAQTTSSSVYLIFQSAYMCLIFIRFFANCLSITSLMIMVTNSADPRHLGVVNGILQSCLALVRAFAPTIGGTLWSYSLTAGLPFPFDHHLVYYLIVAMAFLNLFQLYRIPESLSIGGRKTQQQKISHV